MSDITYVTTKKELKRAVNHKAKYIAITNPKIARYVRVGMVSKTVLIALAVCAIAGGLALTVFPFTITLMAVGASAVVVTSVNIVPLLAILLLGVALILAIWKDYEIDNTFKQTAIGVENRVVLRRKKG